MRKSEVIKILSGSSFKAFHVIKELTLEKQRNNPNFDGWVTMSHNQLRNKTGVQGIFRVIDEFKNNPDIIEVQTYKGVSNKYKINSSLL